MGLVEAINFLTGNLGIGLVEFILLLLNLGGLVWAARDMKVMLVMGFLLNFVLFIAFYEWGLKTESALYLAFGWLVLMVLSLFTSNKKVNPV